MDKHTRLITSIYLPEDEFQGELEGLFIAETEFKTQKELEAFATPDFVVCEVTDDSKFTGGHLAKTGIPKELHKLIHQ